MQSDELEQSIYGAYIPVFTNDSSLLHQEYVENPLSTPPLNTGVWGYNKSFKFSTVFNENSNSMLYNTKKSRVEFDMALCFPTISGVDLSVQFINSILSLGRSDGTVFYDGGFIKNIKVSINNTPLNNSQIGKSFSEHLIKKLIRTCKTYDEYKSIINAAAICGDDRILCPDNDNSTFENDLYNKSVIGSTNTDYDNVWYTLKHLKNGTKYLVLDGHDVKGKSEGASAADNTIPFSVSLRLKDIVDAFEENDYFTSSQINSLDIEIELNHQDYLSKDNIIILNGARLIYDKYMLNSATTKKMLENNTGSANEQSVFCKFISCTSIIDIPLTTGFNAVNIGNFDNAYGNRAISGIGAIENFGLFDICKSYEGMPNSHFFQYIFIPSCVESLQGSNIDGQSIPLQNTLFDITKYEMYKSAIKYDAIPFDRKIYDKLGFVLVRSPMISNTNEQYSIRDGHNLNITVKNGKTIKLIDNAGNSLNVAYIERHILCDLRQIYYCRGRLSDNTVPSGLRLVNGSQTLNSEQVEQYTDAKYAGLNTDILYIQKD